METRRIVVAFFAALLAFLIWSVAAPYILPRSMFPTSRPVASAPAENQPILAETQPASEMTAAPTATAKATAPSSLPSGIRLVEGKSTERILLGDAAATSPFPISVLIDPRGASIAEAKIRGYYETVAKEKPYQIIEPVKTPESGDHYSFTTPKVRFENLKLDVPLEDATWTLNADPNGEIVTGTIDVQTPDGKPLARIIKKFTLPRRTPDTRRFDLDVAVTVQNLTDAPARVILVQQGPMGFRREDLRAEDRSVVGANWDGSQVVAKGRPRQDVAKAQAPIKLGTDESGARIAWAAEINRYFTCIMTPAGRTGPEDPARFADCEALDTTESTDPKAPTEFSALTFQYVSLPRDIPAHGSETIGFNCYIGPKSKKAFQSVPDYARLDYYSVIKQGFYMCAPAALVAVMMRLLDIFHAIWPHNYGLSIIMLVLLVRAILHPITKKSQVNMMKMQKQMAVLQPRLDAVKKKFANDKSQMNQEVMKVYKDAGINPAGNILTCVPLMLQIPIWGALWAALGSTIEMRHAPLDGFWIKDLTAPDALFHFAHPISIPLISGMMGGPFTSLNVLPILLGISQFLQTKYMPRGNTAPRADGAPDQLEQQRKMMMFMSVFFVLMLYNAPSGLNLYIMASNFFGILEQWRIRKHIKDEEDRAQAAGAAGPLDNAPDNKDSDRRVSGRPGLNDPPQKESWIQQKWKDLQKQAEDARRQQSIRDKRGPKR